jgi:hypothetical protein
MGISKYINIPIFVGSLLFGLIIVYITTSDQRKIYVYPSPDNVDVLQYRDKTDSCFKMKETEVPCPKNEKDISKVPVQA